MLVCSSSSSSSSSSSFFLFFYFLKHIISSRNRIGLKNKNSAPLAFPWAYKNVDHLKNIQLIHLNVHKTVNIVYKITTMHPRHDSHFTSISFCTA